MSCSSTGRTSRPQRAKRRYAGRLAWIHGCELSGRRGERCGRSGQRYARRAARAAVDTALHLSFELRIAHPPPLCVQAAIRLYCALVGDYRLQAEGVPVNGRAGANIGTERPTAAALPRNGSDPRAPAAAHAASVRPAAVAPSPADFPRTAGTRDTKATAAAEEAAAAAAAASAALPVRSRVVAHSKSISGPTVYVVESVQFEPHAATAGEPGGTSVVSGARTCVVHRRFSDFRSLHSVIREAVGLPHAFPLSRAMLNGDQLLKRCAGPRGVRTKVACTWTASRAPCTDLARA